MNTIGIERNLDRARIRKLLPMITVQLKAFSEGLTPYPKSARWFCVPVGAITAMVICLLLGAAAGTMLLSFGNAWMFGGLLAAMPDAERFEEFERKLAEGK